MLAASWEPGVDPLSGGSLKTEAVNLPAADGEVEDYKVSIYAPATIRFALAEPRMSCVIFGLAELAHLEEALAAEEMGPLPAEATGQIQSIYQGYRTDGAVDSR